MFTRTHCTVMYTNLDIRNKIKVLQHKVRTSMDYLDKVAKEHGDLAAIALPNTISGDVDEISLWMKVLRNRRCESYKLRNYPCTIVPDEQLWCVSGKWLGDDGESGGGIIEWCTSGEDALAIRNAIIRDIRYSELIVHKYKE